METWDSPTGREQRLAAALYLSRELGLLGQRPANPEGIESGLWQAVDEAQSVLDWRPADV